MTIDRPSDWVRRSLSDADRDLDPRSPEFVAACLAVINQSKNSQAPREPAITRQKTGTVSPGSGTASRSGRHTEPDQATTAHGLVHKLETEIQRLNDQLSSAQKRLNDAAPTLREHTEAREKLTPVRSRELNKGKGPRRRSSAPEQPQPLPQLIEAMLSDHEADKAALKEAGRREDQIRAALVALEAKFAQATTEHDQTTSALEAAVQGETAARAELADTTAKYDEATAALEAAVRDQTAVRDELADSTAKYDQVTSALEAAVQDQTAVRDELADTTTKYDQVTSALEAAVQDQTAVRAELATALKAASDHESAMVQLRQTIADRDEEIRELKERALHAEQARALDAVELRASTQRDHEIALEQLHRVISERDQEITALQSHLLQSEQARAADAAAIIDSLEKYKV